MSLLLILACLRTVQIPLPEHPRPDFQRADWLSLNGTWRFAFDPRDEGLRLGWPGGSLPGNREIVVPFSWGAPLSGVPDSANIGWYAREITVPAEWRGRRVFLVVGACDWRTTVWLDSTKLGDYQGGYMPFSFELPRRLQGGPHRLVLRVDDTPHPLKLEGKQGHGPARGIWPTLYGEPRGSAPLAAVPFPPCRDLEGVRVDARLLAPAPRALTLSVAFDNREGKPVVTRRMARGATAAHLEVPLSNAHRWSLDDPFLHEVTVRVSGNGVLPDRVHTYFGMRTISVVDLPGTNYPYVAINGTPVFLQLALDQAYHPNGYYTFPTDSVLRDEILRARQIGLNGLREHVKIETPRKLYWADRLGVLIMADIPNWWGPPDSAAFQEHHVASRGMIDRDYNHPAIFSWVLFNETWGLLTRDSSSERYLPETRARVARGYSLAKSLDSTRFVDGKWNGYWRFDRSRKETGCGDIARGMTLRDLHAPLYIAVGDSELSRAVWPGERVEVPLYASFLTGSTAYGDSLTLRTELRGWNALGEEKRYSSSTSRIPYRPWMSQPLAPLSVTMPDEPATVVVSVSLEDATGVVLQRNFTTFVVAGTPSDTVRL